MLRVPVRYEGGFVMIPLEFVLDIASHYTARVLVWDDDSFALRIEGLGFNVEGISFSTAADRSTATIKLQEPLLCVADKGTPGLVRLKIYRGRIDPKQFAVRDKHGLFHGVRAEQSERDAYVYFDVDKLSSRIRIERSEEPPEIQVILEKGDLPEIPDPEFSGKKSVEIIGDTPAERRHITIETIVLDPGHGGRDNGKIGVTGVLEKDVNLELAKQLRDLIERELELEVILTREDDRMLSLTQRSEIANQAGGDLFVSIHCNSWFSNQTGGFEAYFMSPARTEGERAVAQAENAADELIGKRDNGSEIDFILWDMVQNEFINESSFFAELVQKAMSDRLEIRNRGVKQANFTVLMGAYMPAVLVETAFLSNPAEEKLLVDPVFQQKVAEGMVEAIQQFRDRYQADAGSGSGYGRSGSIWR
jgi:N-acetylmuramoyl-L-alanine amidase